MNTKKLLFIPVLMLVGHCLMRAQYVEKFMESVNLTPSTETFQFAKQGNITPALYTGAMS